MIKKKETYILPFLFNVKKNNKFLVDVITPKEFELLDIINDFSVFLFI